MKRLGPEATARHMSKAGRQTIMWLLFSVSLSLLLSGFYFGGMAWVLFGVVGLPLLLVALSLALGQASRSNGVFGSKTLYFIGFVITFALVCIAILGDGIEDWSNVLLSAWLPGVIFHLAYKRKIKERGGWI